MTANVKEGKLIYLIKNSIFCSFSNKSCKWSIATFYFCLWVLVPGTLGNFFFHVRVCTCLYCVSFPASSSITPVYLCAWIWTDPVIFQLQTYRWSFLMHVRKEKHRWILAGKIQQVDLFFPYMILSGFVLWDKWLIFILVLMLRSHNIFKIKCNH